MDVQTDELIQNQLNIRLNFFFKSINMKTVGFYRERFHFEDICCVNVFLVYFWLKSWQSVSPLLLHTSQGWGMFKYLISFLKLYFKGHILRLVEQ